MTTDTTDTAAQPTAPTTAAPAEKAVPKGGLGEKKSGWFVRITVLAVVILWIIPTLGVLVTSFRPEALVDATGWWTVLWNPFTADDGTAQWTFQNYREALDAGGFGNAFLNSLAVTLPATVIPITIAAFAAYAFSWMNFRGRFVMFVFVVGLLVVPLQMALIPVLRLYTEGASLGGAEIFPDLDLAGEFLGVWLAHTAFGLPLAVYLLRNYIGSLPSSIIESAKIDGADHFTIFWRLVVPLSVPALAAFAIFQFLWVWNDLLVAYVFLGGTRQNRVLTIALQSLVGARGENWHLLTAAGFITMALPLVVFFALQRYFVRGLTAGAVKG
jgi:alpha-glucoside transport system permease protein